MGEARRRRHKAVAAGTVGLACLMGVAAAGLVIAVAAADRRTAPPAQPAGPTDWAARAAQALAAGGYGFAAASFERGILTVTGEAPGEDARQRAYAAGRDAVLDDPAHAGTVLAFLNAITVDGVAPDTVPDAASALGEAPVAQACQTAYDTLLDGRTITFDSGSAIIAAASGSLLDALAAVAARCEGYRVEIGGHTDARGDDGANQVLSERRAQSVADYLVGRGVPAALLGVVGYGETRPLDGAGTAEADARNRRIEFKVEARP